jgi:hypothetical protein
MNMNNPFADNGPQTYFIISSGEDGISIEGPLSKDQVLDKFETSWYGPLGEFYDKVPECEDGYFMRQDIDNERRLLIIQGKIVVPKPKTKVTAYDL